MELVEIRVRTKIPKDELDKKIGKIITEKDYNILLTGPSRVTLPNGKPLCVYLPNALNGEEFNSAYEILHTIKSGSNNRQLASGTPQYTTNKTHRSGTVASSIIGNVDHTVELQHGLVRIRRSSRICTLSLGTSLS